MPNRVVGMILVGLMAASAVACKPGDASSDGTGASSPSIDAAEHVRSDVAAVIASDPRLADETTALTPDDYKPLAAKIAAVPGVEGADYTGDTLGTIYIKVQDGGIMVYRHIVDDFSEDATLPPEADLSKLRNATWNDAGWLPGVPAEPAASSSNTYATRFPVALADPDPQFAADGAVACPNEGKIALVDFTWSALHVTAPGLYTSQFDVDGVMLYDRLQRMAQAAGFGFDVFHDADINLTNYTKLQDYRMVITIGHGGKPGIYTNSQFKDVYGSMLTPEDYEPTKTTAFGMTYEDAWKKGYLYFGPNSKKISWTPALFRDHYRPTVDQHFMLNSCWSMLPFNVGLDEVDGKWQWDQTPDGKTPAPLYNFGDALMDAGVKVVFGYSSTATPEAIVRNTVPYFRRMFGAHSATDLPPAPLGYWPTCMGAQTWFRNPSTPGEPSFADKLVGHSVYTMYAVPDNQMFRNVCSPAGANAHASMQQFVFSTGTPATVFHTCWDEWWASGKAPNGLQDFDCSQGESPTTLEATTDAACAVKEARQVTNAMLTR